MLPAAGDRRRDYDRWAPTYPAIAHNPVMRAEQAIVEPLLRRLRPRRALDVGTGSGRYLRVLASLGAASVGVDFSFAMLTAASRPAPPRVCADACRLPFRGSRFDVVNSSLMVGDIADLAAWTREIARVLTPRGHLVYSDFHPTWTTFGWRRTFRSVDGDMHEIPFEPHTIEQHLDALDAAGFELRAIREPRLVAGGDRSVAAFRKQWGDPSVVVVFHATHRT